VFHKPHCASLPNVIANCRGQTDNKMKNIFTKKYFIYNYGCSFALAAILLIAEHIPFLAYLYMFLILGGLLIHYHLTNLFRFILTILSFFVNFVIWTAEQVNLESTFHYTPFYQSGDYKYLIVLLGTFLWVTNKIIIDFLFILFKAQTKEMNIELLIQKLKNKAQSDI
jgi:hypothetical protein